MFSEVDSFLSFFHGLRHHVHPRHFGPARPESMSFSCKKSKNPRKTSWMVYGTCLCGGICSMNVSRVLNVWLNSVCIHHKRFSRAPRFWCWGSTSTRTPTSSAHGRNSSAGLSDTNACRWSSKEICVEGEHLHFCYRWAWNQPPSELKSLHGRFHPTSHVNFSYKGVFYLLTVGIPCCLPCAHHVYQTRASLIHALHSRIHIYQLSGIRRCSFMALRANERAALVSRTLSDFQVGRQARCSRQPNP